MQWIDYLPLLLPVGRVKSEFLFNFTGYTLTTREIERLVDASALFVDTDGYDMDMMTIYILMLDDDIRLVSISHPFHVLTGYSREVAIRQFVIRMGIE